MQKKPDASHHPDGVPAFGASLNRNKPHKAAWIEQAFHTGQETKNMLKSYVTFDPFMPIDPKLDKHRSEIEALLANASTQKFIAKRYKSSPANLANWMKKRGIKKPKL